MYIPLIELAQNPAYMKQNNKSLKLNNPSTQPDSLNLANEIHEIEVGHVVEEESTKYTSPFYIKLRLHGNLIHISM